MTNQSIAVEQSPVQEILEQVIVFLRDVWRFRKQGVIGIWVVAILGWVLVFMMPDKYEATARVYVDTESILRPLLKGLAVENNLDERLSLMTKTLLSRPNMEKVILAHDMDVNVKDEKDKEALIKKMRKSIHIGATRRHNLYTISYENQNPKLAKAVVQSLLTIFVETTLGGSRQDSDIARKFLTQQIKEYEEKLVAAEKRLMAFKRENMGLLPGQGLDYFGRLQKTQAELEQAVFELNQAKHRRDELNRQLKELVQSASKPGLNNVVTSADTRIQKLRGKLDDLLLRFTEEHPDVTEIKLTIAQLEKQREEELKAISQGGTSKEMLEASPVYQELRLTMGKASSDVAAAEVRVAEFKKRIKNLEGRVGTLPEIEAELANLNRDYEINKEQYATLLARRESAKMSEEAETAGDKVKFQIIEPPHVPSTPSSPKRPLLNVLVFFAAIASGFGLIFILSQVSPVIYNKSSLARITGYPVYGEVSISTREDLINETRKEYRIYLLYLGGLVATFVLVLVLNSILGMF
ncbi:MAG: chain length-determining protein [Gammaproteobacteria bacterium]|nr:chain length-determining protein [Gammaproteobacteria bacterium]MDH5652385.1 chain length-determining protein [Gammaproteobacteria bacterium]